MDQLGETLHFSVSDREVARMPKHAGADDATRLAARVTAQLEAVADHMVFVVPGTAESEDLQTRTTTLNVLLHELKAVDLVVR